MKIDVESVRNETPAVAHLTHLNNCGSSLPPTPVLNAAIDYLNDEAAMGGYEAWAQRSVAIDEVYGSTARYLNCDVGEVAFTASASDGWWRAFTSVPLASGDRILMSRSEFQANAFGLLQARDRGVVVDVVPNTPAGEIDLEQLEKMLDGSVKLVSLTHISMANGAVHPAADVGALAHRAGALFLLDSCQAAGQRPLDVEELQCDFLCYTGRKFMRAMRGTGILYARSSAIDRLGPSPFVDGRSAEWTSPDEYRFAPGALRFEFGEQNFAGKVALGVATNYMLKLGLGAISDRITDLSTRLRQGLQEIDGITLRDEGVDQCGIVTFTSNQAEPASIQKGLAVQRINLGAPGKRNAQLDIGARGLDAVVRAGVHYFNTEDEIDMAVAAIRSITS